jgi:hypothetical protein
VEIIFLSPGNSSSGNAPETVLAQITFVVGALARSSRLESSFANGSVRFEGSEIVLSLDRDGRLTGTFEGEPGVLGGRGTVELSRVR